MMDNRKHPFGIERFYKKVFTMVLGSILMIVPFYAGVLQMLLLTDKTAEWQLIHWIFFTAGVVLFVGGMMLNKIAEIGVRSFEAFIEKFLKK